MSIAPLRIENATLETTGDRMTLSGSVDRDVLFWSMPASPTIALRGEPFVAALLPGLMRAGRDLVLPEELPVDAAFIRHIDKLQALFTHWFPALQQVAVTVSRVGPAPHVEGRYTGYSGGVDSSFTVMELEPSLDGVVLVDGIEYRAVNRQLMTQVDERLRETMDARGLRMITVQTNAKVVGRGVGGYWSEFIGGSLASAPHALGLASYAIAGSNSWENLRPYGTHPYSDPLWSSSQLQISHHGTAHRRIDKLAALQRAPDLLAVLRVCFQGKDYNCGVCHKCLQTSAAMRALGITSPAMPPLVDASLLRRMHVEHDGDLVDWAEILVPGLSSSDPSLFLELTRLMGRYRWRKVGRALDDALTGGRLQKMKKARKRAAP